MLITGDLRALYVLWLCRVMDGNEDIDELLEPPVPHGLGTVPEQVKDLLSFFTVDPLLVAAAAVGVTATCPQSSQRDSVQLWLSTLDESCRAKIIERLVTEDPVAVKSEILAEIPDSQQAVPWLCESPQRTIAELMKQCDVLRQKEYERQRRNAETNAKRAAAKAEKQRLTRMEEMKSSPESWLTKASKLVEERGRDNYREAASILADLRKALGAANGDRIVRTHAAHLAKQYPTLTMLKSSLRKQGLLD